MKLAHTANAVRTVPEDQLKKPEGEQIAYYLSPPTAYSKAEFHRALARRGARMPQESLILDCLAQGVRDLLPAPADKEVRDGFLADIEAYRDQVLQSGFAEAIKLWLDPHNRVNVIKEIVRRGDARFAGLEADRAFYWEAQGIEACRMFLVGWDNRAPDFERGQNGVPDPLLVAISDAHKEHIGLVVGGLLNPDPVEAKKSGSPSPGGSSPKTSRSGATAKGRRKRSPSKATPGSSRK